MARKTKGPSTAETDMAELVNIFAQSVIDQDEATNSRDGNRHAHKLGWAFDELIRRYGDRGRDALLPLLEHSYPRIRCMAAVHLLRYRHEEAMKVLKELAGGKGLVAFGALASIRNWYAGDWELDPEPKKEG